MKKKITAYAECKCYVLKEVIVIVKTKPKQKTYEN